HQFAYGQPQLQPQLQQAFGYGSPFAPGLQHTSAGAWQGVPQYVQYGQYGYPQVMPQLGAIPWGAPLQPGFAQGIQHPNPWYGSPYGVPQAWGIQPQLGFQGQAGMPFGPFGGGIQHTSAPIDPAQAMQLAQIFPNALYNVPTVTIV